MAAPSASLFHNLTVVTPFRKTTTADADGTEAIAAASSIFVGSGKGCAACLVWTSATPKHV